MIPVVIPESNSGSMLSKRMEARSSVDIFLKERGKREMVGILLSVLLYFKFFSALRKRVAQRSQHEHMKLLVYF